MNQSQSAESMQQSPEVAEKQKDQQEKTPEKASRSKQEASVCVREFLQQNEAKLENSDMSIEKMQSKLSTKVEKLFQIGEGGKEISENLLSQQNTEDMDSLFSKLDKISEDYDAVESQLGKEGASLYNILLDSGETPDALVDYGKDAISSVKENYSQEVWDKLVQIAQNPDKFPVGKVKQILLNQVKAEQEKQETKEKQQKNEKAEEKNEKAEEKNEKAEEKNEKAEEKNEKAEKKIKQEKNETTEKQQKKEKIDEKEEKIDEKEGKIEEVGIEIIKEVSQQAESLKGVLFENGLVEEKEFQDKKEQNLQKIKSQSNLQEMSDEQVDGIAEAMTVQSYVSSPDIEKKLPQEQQKQVEDFLDSYDTLDDALGLSPDSMSNLSQNDEIYHTNESLNEYISSAQKESDDIIQNNDIDGLADRLFSETNNENINKIRDTIQDNMMQGKKMAWGGFTQMLSEGFNQDINGKNLGNMLDVDTQSIEGLQDGEFESKVNLGDVETSLRVDNNGDVYLTDYFSKKEGNSIGIGEKKINSNFSLYSVKDFDQQINEAMQETIAEEDISSLEDFESSFQNKLQEKIESMQNEVAENDIIKSSLSYEMQRVEEGKEMMGMYIPPEEVENYNLSNSQESVIAKSGNPQLFDYMNIVKNTLDYNDTQTFTEISKQMEKLRNLAQEEDVEGLSAFDPDSETSAQSQNFMEFMEKFTTQKYSKKMIDETKLSQFVKKAEKSKNSDSEETDEADKFLDNALKDI